MANCNPQTTCSCLQCTTLCGTCVRRGLSSAHMHHRVAATDWETTRRECETSLKEVLGDSPRRPQDQELNQRHGEASSTTLLPVPDLSETAWEIRNLQERLERQRQECAERALEVTQKAVELEDRQSELHDRLQQITQQRQHLSKLALFEECVVTNIASSEQQARMLRVQWAVQALEFHRVQVHPLPVKGKAQGIGKIGGLPLPHAGLELFGVLPPAELESALRLVACLVQTVSQCLAVSLPHPVLLTPPPVATTGSGGSSGSPTAANNASTTLLKNPLASSSSTTSSTGSNNSAATAIPSVQHVSDIADMTDYGSSDSSEKATASSSDKGLNYHGLMSSTSSLVASWMSSGTSRTTGSSSQKKQKSKQQQPDLTSYSSMLQDGNGVQRRIQHARAAILAENEQSGASHYALVCEQTEAFAIAWQLLQNDLIALCIRAGVPVQDLWPAEAVLLNLYALYKHLQQEIDSSESNP